MPGFKGTYLDNKALDHVLGGPDYARPATVYCALYTVMPTKDGGGTEVNGQGYARKAITNNATNFPPAVDGVKTNGASWDFGTAGSNWGTIVGAALDDADGHILYAGPLSVPITVNAGSPFSIAAGNATFTES